MEAVYSKLCHRRHKYTIIKICCLMRRAVGIDTEFLNIGRKETNDRMQSNFYLFSS